jgi:hypothetical protein
LQTCSLLSGLVSVAVDGLMQTRVDAATKAKPAGRFIVICAPAIAPVVSLL